MSNRLMCGLALLALASGAAYADNTVNVDANASVKHQKADETAPTEMKSEAQGKGEQAAASAQAAGKATAASAKEGGRKIEAGTKATVKGTHKAVKSTLGGVTGAVGGLTGDTSVSVDAKAEKKSEDKPSDQ